MIELYIFKDKSFKLHFEPGLFDLSYKDFESENEKKAYMEFTWDRGLPHETHL